MKACFSWLQKVSLLRLSRYFLKLPLLLPPMPSVTLNANLAQHTWKPPFRSCSASRSVSGKRVCSYCNNILGKGAAMIIETLGLSYHLHCFKVSLSQRACRRCQCRCYHHRCRWPAALCLESAWLLWAPPRVVDVPLTSLVLLSVRLCRAGVADCLLPLNFPTWNLLLYVSLEGLCFL